MIVKIPKDGMCCYCGDTGPLTEDHVPARLFFPKKSRGRHKVVVPACQQCNQGANSDDEYMRPRLLMRSELDTNDEARAVFSNFKDQVRRRESAGFAASLREDFGYSDLFNGSDLWIGRHPTLKVDDGRLKDFTERLVKAFYFLEFGKRLSEVEKIVIHAPGLIRRRDQPYRTAQAQAYLSREFGKMTGCFSNGNGRVLRFIPPHPAHVGPKPDFARGRSFTYFYSPIIGGDGVPFSLFGFLFYEETMLMAVGPS